jgi:hypothetical protein
MLNTNQFLPVALKYFNGISFQLEICPVTSQVLIIKSLILPLFTFLASVCLVPDIYHKEIEKKCFKFAWNGKPDKVKRNLIINSYISKVELNLNIYIC